MKTYKRVMLVLITLVIFLLYLAFLYIDLIIKVNNSGLSSISSILKYISICFCFTLSLLIGKNSVNTFDKRLLQLGLFFTTIADLCLLLLDKIIIGITIFCVVQLCYIVRFNRNSYYQYIQNLLFILFSIIILTIILKKFHISAEPLYIISIFYASCLLTTVLSVFRTKKKMVYSTLNLYFCIWGMLLFMLCDINVAIYNITNQVSSLNLSWINSLSNNLIWIFYLPSQLLLSLSGFNFNKKYFYN